MPAWANGVALTATRGGVPLATAGPFAKSVPKLVQEPIAQSVLVSLVVAGPMEQGSFAIGLGRPETSGRSVCAAGTERREAMGQVGLMG